MLTLLLVNVQSLRNKTDELSLFLDGIGYPGLVLVTEHWLREDEIVFVPGYTILSSFCRSSSSHGGCMIFASRSFLENNSFQPIVKYNDLLEEVLFEFTIVFSGKLNLYVLCIYRSPLSSVKLFLDKLDTLLSHISSNASIVLCGDFNINFSDEGSIDTINLRNLLSSNNLRMHVTAPTRHSRYSSSTIDYVCSNFEEDRVECSVLNAALSDHEAVFFRVLGNDVCARSVFRFGRIFSRENYASFHHLCTLTSWDHVMNSEDPLKAFHGTVCELFCNAFPKRKIRVKPHKKPWFTKGLKISSKNLRSLHAIRKYTDCPSLQQYFARYRSIYRKLISLAKHRYYCDRLKKSRNKQRESWNIVNDIRNSNTHVVVDNPNMSPDFLNNYYCTIAEKLTNTSPSSVDPLSYLSNISVENSFYFLPTDLEELKTTLLSIKNKNSSGTDCLSTRVFLNMPDCVLAVLVEAINSSWQSGVFSTVLKTAKVIPLPKGGDLDDPSNFRPIALLSTLSKIIEKMVKSRLSSFLSINNILSGLQFGFRQGSSTNDAMFDMLSTLFSRINDGGVAAVAFCDLTKAFDCVNHTILFRKLGRYGIRGLALSWFESFLSGRSQRVFVGSSCSSPHAIDRGVPQGSVLGPLLFLLYVNDLAELRIRGKFTIFADDTTILWHCLDAAALGASIVSDLRQLRIWCDANMMSLNLDKTKIVTFKCALDGLIIENAPILSTSESTFLGLTIDRNLNFEPHILSLARKVSSGCFAVKLITRELGAHVGRSVYFALIGSRLRYGIAFWGATNNQLFNSLFVIQKRAVRYIYGVSSRTSCRPLFIGNKILTLTCLYILETACLIFTNRDKYTIQSSGYMTRQHGDLRPPIPSSSLIKRSIIYQGVKIYNHLPNDLRSSATTRIFRNRLKRILISKAYYELHEFYADNFD